MALISHLVKELALNTGTAEKSITVIARWLREDGLLSQKGRGRGAAQATPLDAARLLIALMVGGKMKNAPQAVRDFGQMVLSRDIRDKQMISLEELFGLPDDHTFEEGIAALIGMWGNEDALRATTKILDSLWEEYNFSASIQTSDLGAWIHVADAEFGYIDPTFAELSTLDIGSAERFDRMKAAFTSVLVRYESGIASVRTVDDLLLRSLGEVVADLREPGSMQLPDELIPQSIDGGGDA